MSVFVKWPIKWLIKWLFVPTLFLAAGMAQALPIGFGRNQGDLRFSEASSENFIVYFDRETPAEGRFTLGALEAARPHLERWIGIKRDKALPVIISSVTNGASFANFVTDALEIQTMGQGDRALVWHEYTHAMMYRHMNNMFGPAGAILHLPWMPVWFIEGLAEATSVSVGSDFMASVERHQALTGEWPSYDRMHSLYGSAFSSRGYAVSGAFVTWFLQKSDGAARLPQILQRFRDKSMPWWWPWAAVPFNGFMPMDDSLGTPGRELFRQYQEESTAKHRKEEGDAIRLIATGTAVPVEQVAKNRDIRVGQDLIWLEQRKDVTRFCRRDVARRGPVTCPAEARFPASLDVLGVDPVEKKVYLSQRHHNLTGDRFDILSWRPGEKTPTPATLKFSAVNGLHPVAVARDGEDLLMIGAGRTHRYLIAFAGKATDKVADKAGGGACLGMHRMVDFPILMESLSASTNLTMAFWTPAGTVARRFQAGQLRRELPLSDCKPVPGPSSPLLEAVRLGAAKNINLDGALGLASHPVKQVSTEIPGPKKSDVDGNAGPEIEVRDAKWRGRSVLAFPWIGADDALGPQFGFVSVPLMDHLQNETLRLSFLVGAASRYPNTDLRLISTRWRPTLSLAMFRQQTYNGLIRDSSDGSLALSYLDEAGIKGDADIAWHVGPFGGSPSSEVSGAGTTIVLSTGFKRSVLEPYIGPKGVRSGWLNEFSLGLAASTNFMAGRLGLSEGLFARVAPEAINGDFDYDAVGAQVNLAWDPQLLRSRFGFGVETSRTRGQKKPALREVYRPLKTFVPGSGGGFNKNSFAVAGEGWLLAGRYGDTQGRVKADWTVPLVEDFEKLLWIFYLDRLDFSAFLNYGGAWNGASPAADRLIAAHGYNLDLQLDNKGVRFNVGGGVGQVFEKPWEAYMTVGFDALF